MMCTYEIHPIIKGRGDSTPYHFMVSSFVVEETDILARVSVKQVRYLPTQFSLVSRLSKVFQ